MLGLRRPFGLHLKGLMQRLSVLLFLLIFAGSSFAQAAPECRFVFESSIRHDLPKLSSDDVRSAVADPVKFPQLIEQMTGFDDQGHRWINRHVLNSAMTASISRVTSAVKTSLEKFKSDWIPRLSGSANKRAELLAQMDFIEQTFTELVPSKFAELGLEDRYRVMIWTHELAAQIFESYGSPASGDFGDFTYERNPLESQVTSLYMALNEYHEQTFARSFTNRMYGQKFARKNGTFVQFQPIKIPDHPLSAPEGLMWPHFFSENRLVENETDFAHLQTLVFPIALVTRLIYADRRMQTPVELWTHDLDVHIYRQLAAMHKHANGNVEQLTYFRYLIAKNLNTHSRWNDQDNFYALRFFDHEGGINAWFSFLEDALARTKRGRFVVSKWFLKRLLTKKLNENGADRLNTLYKGDIIRAVIKARNELAK